MIELLIVVTIMPLIAGALGYGLVTVFSLQAVCPARLGDSSDAQVVAANFTKDVQSASRSPQPATPLCGPTTQTQLLGWSGAAAAKSSPTTDRAQTGTTYSWCEMTVALIHR